MRHKIGTQMDQKSPKRGSSSWNPSMGIQTPPPPGHIHNDVYCLIISRLLTTPNLCDIIYTKLLPYTKKQSYLSTDDLVDFFQIFPIFLLCHQATPMEVGQGQMSQRSDAFDVQYLNTFFCSAFIMCSVWRVQWFNTTHTCVLGSDYCTVCHHLTRYMLCPTPCIDEDIKRYMLYVSPCINEGEQGTMLNISA